VCVQNNEIIHTSIKEGRKKEINRKNNKIINYIPWNILRLEIVQSEINNK